MLLPLWSLTTDAKGVVVNQEIYNVHDVTGTMKQFFRNLPDPLLTHHLYDQFIECAREWSLEGCEGCVCEGGGVREDVREEGVREGCVTEEDVREEDVREEDVREEDVREEGVQAWQT